MKKTYALAGAAASLALLVSGCGSSSSSSSGAAATPTPSPSTSPSTSSSPSASASATPGTSSTPAAAAMITIKNFGYTVPASVKPGTKVMVMNEDSEAHTVTADSSGGFDVTVPAGGSATLTAPTKAGSYKFHCNYHSNMHGTLVVS